MHKTPELRKHWRIHKPSIHKKYRTSKALNLKFPHSRTPLKLQLIKARPGKLGHKFQKEISVAKNHREPWDAISDSPVAHNLSIPNFQPSTSNFVHSQTRVQIPYALQNLPHQITNITITLALTHNKSLTYNTIFRQELKTE